MEKANWKNDTFLRTRLADTATAPKAIKEPKFDKQITFVVKPKSGQIYTKTCPEWAVDTVKNMLDNDLNVSRYFIKE